MEKILKEVDRILKKVRQEEKVKVQNRVDLLNGLIKRTQEREIVLTATDSKGRREILMINPRGLFLWDEGRYMYNKMIDLAHGDIEEWANGSGGVGSVLQKALEGEVEIDIT